MPEILSAGEVPRKLVELKDSWYAIAQRCEALSQFKSGLNDSFKNSLSVLLQDLKGFEGLLDDVCIATQMHVPSKRDEVEEIRAPFVSSLRGLENSIEENLKLFKRHSELSPKLEEVSKSLHNLRERHEDLKKHATRLCDQYSQTKTEYDQKISNIREATDRELQKIKEKFVADVSSMFEGYYIVSKNRQEELTLDLLLERLIQDPAYYQKVDVMHRGIFGRRRSDIETRLVLLQYKAEEVTVAIKPILEEEKRRLSKFEGEEKRINELGMQCRESKEEERGLAVRREALEKEVSEFEGEINNIKAKFENYAKLAELVDLYVRKFGETTAARNKLSAIIESSFAAYEPIERDVEKRELRTEVKALRSKADSLELAKANLEKELGDANRLIKEKDAKIGSLTSQLEKMKSTESELRGDLATLTTTKDSLERELKSTKDDLESKNRHIDSLEDKIVSLTSSNASLEGNVKDLESKIKEMRGELDAAVEEKDEMRFKLMETEGNYNVVNSKFKDANSQVASLKMKLDESEKKLFDALREKDSFEEQLKAKDRELRRMGLDAEKVTKKLEEAREEASRYKSELSETSRKLIDESRAHSALKAEHERMVTELEDVRAEVAKLEGEVATRMKATEPVSKKKTAAVAKSKVKTPPPDEDMLLKDEEEAVVGEKISALRKKK